MISPTPKVLTEADLAGLPRAVSLIERLTEEADLCAHDGADDIAELLMEAVDVLRTLVSERDALAGRVAELEAALWGCIAAIERTHHCTEEDRLAAADKARAALSATTPESKP